MITPVTPLWVHYQNADGKYATSIQVQAIAQVGNGFTAIVLHDGKFVPAFGISNLKVTTIDNRNAKEFLKVRDEIVATRTPDAPEQSAPVLDQKLLDKLIPKSKDAK